MDAKIEPRLQKEIDRLQSAGDVRVVIPVVIELQSSTELQPSRSRGDLGSEFAEVEKKFREYLQGLGVSGEVAPLLLANSLQASLNLQQIAAVAGHPQVRRIVWNRTEQVVA